MLKLDKIAQEWNIKNWITTVVLFLILTDLSIILDIPVLKPLLSFVFFTLVPGYLIFLILKLKKINLIKKIVFSVGMSVSFLMIIGMALNSLYPFLAEPLSFLPVFTAVNVFVVLLVGAVYWRNRDNLEENAGFKFDLNGKLTSPIIFPFLFPLLAILGTYIMNIYQNNTLLLLMLILIPVYLIAVVYFRDKVHSATYPLALWLIGLSMLLMHGLTSQHVLGIDVHFEYYMFQFTQMTYHWDINAYYNPYNACMSITILPMVYHVLSGVGGEYVFKLFMAFIGSTLPLLVYLVSKKYLSGKYAFMAALLFIFQLFFINILGAVRQEIAVMFFFLTVLVIFDHDLDKRFRKALIVLFIFATLISHYSTAYVAFVLIVPLLLYPFARSLIVERKLNLTNFDILIISLVLIAIWYFLVAKVQFASGAQVLTKTVEVTAAKGVASALVGTRGAYVLGILGVVIKSLPNMVSVIAHDLIFATILLGLVEIFRRFRYYREKFETEFILGIVISLALLVLFVALPYISIAYDAARLFFQLIIFLAPVFVIGGMFLARLLKRPKKDIYILLILLLFLFTCVTYIQYSLLGDQYSAYYEEDGRVRQGNYVFESEVVSANWISQNRMDNITIYSDGREVARFLTAYGPNIDRENINGSYFGWNETVDIGYIYLGYANIHNHKIIDMGDDFIRVDIARYEHLLTGKSTIYDNGGSRILL